MRGRLSPSPLVVPAGTGVPAPWVSSVAPTSGAAAGGTPITITGKWFSLHGQGTHTVRMGANFATDVVAVSDTSITCVSPAGAGVVSVIVAHDAGSFLKPTAYTFT